MNADWMGRLAEIGCLPITEIAIPGSHDSCADELLPNAPVALDQPKWIRWLGRWPFVRRIIYRWSITQNSNIMEQLKLGIRYWDLRVCKSDYGSKEIRFVHGLYGTSVEEVLLMMREFLEKHRGEVLLLDFNHFYNFDEKTHEMLHALIVRVFGNEICPRTRPDLVTLDGLRACEQRVIIIYQCDGYIHHNFWTACHISAPYADTDCLSELVVFLDRTATSGQPYLYVAQAILTPRLGDVFFHLGASLERRFASRCTEAISEWLRGDCAPLVNIVLCDFVEQFDFCDAVINLNRRLSLSSTVSANCVDDDFSMICDL